MMHKMYVNLMLKVKKDYEEIVKEYLEMEKLYIINSAYELAHYNEITDFFDSIDEEDSSPLSEEECKKIINYKGNVIRKIYENWQDYNHPERYNFFCYEDLGDIVSYAVNHALC